MIRFLLSSFLMFCLLSCGPKITKDLTAVPITKTQITNPYFADDSQDYIYKAKLDIYGNYFGGILIIKKISEEKHRVVFTTEFGSKIFDFLYDGDTFTKNFILPDLDKKIVVNTLKKDFEILISENHIVEKQFMNSAYNVYKTSNNTGNNYYFVNTVLKESMMILNSPNKRTKIKFVLDDIVENIAQTIYIRHNNIKLSIALKYLKK